MFSVYMQIEPERIASLLACGFEGGVNYWCSIEGYVKPEDLGDTSVLHSDDPPYPHIDYPLHPGGCVVVLTGGKTYRLDHEAIKRGLDLFVKTPHAGQWLAEDEDADTGDAFIQLCLFGDVIYG